MDHKTRDVLIAARAIIADPAMWYQGDWSASGELRDLDEPCCAEAAIRRIAPRDTAHHTIERMAQFTPDYTQLRIFNDATATTHADIMAVFDRAIAGEQVA